MGCSGASKEGPYDPFEKTNRGIYAFNQAVEKNVMRPVGKTYRTIVPQWGRNRVLNFFRNLASPIIFMNDVLQGESRRAGETLYRFMVNTTFGLGGLFDVANEAADVKYHSEDFGQTLAVWGVGEGPYITVPFLYPMSTRELAGKVIDIIADPVYEEPPMDELNGWERVGVGAADVMTQYVETIDQIEGMEKIAMDPYAMTKSVLYQKRQEEIQNGRKPEDKEGEDGEKGKSANYDFEMDFDDE